MPNLNPIVIRGEFMYDSVTQERFFARGVCYEPDPLVNPSWSNSQCTVVSENSVASVGCSAGTISSVDFASYGTPTGDCGNEFAVDSTCDAATTRSVVEAACLGELRAFLEANA